MANQTTHTSANSHEASVPLALPETHQRAATKSRTQTPDGLNSRLRKRVNREYDPAHVRAALDSGIAKNGTQAAAFALTIADRRRMNAELRKAAWSIQVDDTTVASIEVHGVHADADTCRIDNTQDQPSFYSVYLQQQTGGVECLRDFVSHDAARAYGHALSNRIGVPFRDCHLAEQLTAPRRPVSGSLRSLVGKAHCN